MAEKEKKAKKEEEKGGGVSVFDPPFPFIIGLYPPKVAIVAEKVRLGQISLQQAMQQFPPPSGGTPKTAKSNAESNGNEKKMNIDWIAQKLAKRALQKEPEQQQQHKEPVAPPTAPPPLPPPVPALKVFAAELRKEAERIIQILRDYVKKNEFTDHDVDLVQRYTDCIPAQMGIPVDRRSEYLKQLLIELGYPQKVWQKVYHEYQQRQDETTIEPTSEAPLAPAAPPPPPAPAPPAASLSSTSSAASTSPSTPSPLIDAAVPLFEAFATFLQSQSPNPLLPTPPAAAPPPTTTTTARRGRGRKPATTNSDPDPNPRPRRAHNPVNKRVARTGEPIPIPAFAYPKGRRPMPKSPPSSSSASAFPLGSPIGELSSGMVHQMSMSMPESCVAGELSLDGAAPAPAPPPPGPGPPPLFQMAPSPMMFQQMWIQTLQQQIAQQQQQQQQPQIVVNPNPKPKPKPPPVKEKKPIGRPRKKPLPEPAPVELTTTPMWGTSSSSLGASLLQSLFVNSSASAQQQQPTNAIWSQEPAPVQQTSSSSQSVQRQLLQSLLGHPAPAPAPAPAPVQPSTSPIWGSHGVEPESLLINPGPALAPAPAPPAQQPTNPIWSHVVEPEPVPVQQQTSSSPQTVERPLLQSLLVNPAPAPAPAPAQPSTIWGSHVVEPESLLGNSAPAPAPPLAPAPAPAQQPTNQIWSHVVEPPEPEPVQHTIDQPLLHSLLTKPAPAPPAPPAPTQQPPTTQICGNHVVEPEPEPEPSKATSSSPRHVATNDFTSIQQLVASASASASPSTSPSAPSPVVAPPVSHEVEVREEPTPASAPTSPLVASSPETTISFPTVIRPEPTYLHPKYRKPEPSPPPPLPLPPPPPPPKPAVVMYVRAAAISRLLPIAECPETPSTPPPSLAKYYAYVAQSMCFGEFPNAGDAYKPLWTDEWMLSVVWGPEQDPNFMHNPNFRPVLVEAMRRAKIEKDTETELIDIMNTWPSVRRDPHFLTFVRAHQATTDKEKPVGYLKVMGHSYVTKALNYLAAKFEDTTPCSVDAVLSFCIHNVAAYCGGYPIKCFKAIFEVIARQAPPSSRDVITID